MKYLFLITIISFSAYSFQNAPQIIKNSQEIVTLKVSKNDQPVIKLCQQYPIELNFLNEKGNLAPVEDIIFDKQLEPVIGLIQRHEENHSMILLTALSNKTYSQMLKKNEDLSDTLRITQFNKETLIIKVNLINCTSNKSIIKVVNVQYMPTKAIPDNFVNIFEPLVFQKHPSVVVVPKEDVISFNSDTIEQELQLITEKEEQLRLSKLKKQDLDLTLIKKENQELKDRLTDVEKKALHLDLIKKENQQLKEKMTEAQKKELELNLVKEEYEQLKTKMTDIEQKEIEFQLIEEENIRFKNRLTEVQKKEIELASIKEENQQLKSKLDSIIESEEQKNTSLTEEQEIEKDLLDQEELLNLKSEESVDNKYSVLARVVDKTQQVLNREFINLDIKIEENLEDQAPQIASLSVVEHKNAIDIEKTSIVPVITKKIKKKQIVKEEPAQNEPLIAEKNNVLIIVEEKEVPTNNRQNIYNGLTDVKVSDIQEQVVAQQSADIQKPVVNKNEEILKKEAEELEKRSQQRIKLILEQIRQKSKK